MRRFVGPLAFAAAALLSADSSAQGILDLFAPEQAQRAAPRPARDVRRAAPSGKRAAEPKARKGVGRKVEKTAPAKSETPGAEAPPPPYEGQLVRLSEVLGAIAFLRDLCGEKDGDDWRGKLSTLLDAEAPNGARREKYVAAFNRGFRGYELTYRVCTPNAKVATGRFLDEAAQISRDVAYRFGSP
jgi:uncharacterized protein (TIGR02301 family)